MILPHRRERLCETAEGGGDVAGEGDGVFVVGGTGVDLVEGGEEGGEVGASGRLGGGLVWVRGGDVVFDCVWLAGVSIGGRSWGLRRGDLNRGGFVGG